MSDSLSFFARTRSDGRIGFWWLADDSGCWQDAKTDLRRTFNHASGLRYDADHREWSLPRHSIDRLQRWANAWAYNRQEWAAAPRTGRRSYDDHAQDQDPWDAPRPALTAAYARLHLLPTAPPELVTAAYRALSQLHHPDRGGDTRAMAALNEAVAVLREAATRGAS